jgi:hypothetical protein
VAVAAQGRAQAGGLGRLRVAEKLGQVGGILAACRLDDDLGGGRPDARECLQ